MGKTVTTSFKGKHLQQIRPKEKICVFPVTSKKKIRVGRSLLIFFFFKFLFFIFPDFTKKHNKCVVCMKYITKRGLFGLFTYNTEWMPYCKGIS